MAWNCRFDGGGGNDVFPGFLWRRDVERLYGDFGQLYFCRDFGQFCSGSESEKRDLPYVYDDDAEQLERVVV